MNAFTRRRRCALMIVTLAIVVVLATTGCSGGRPALPPVTTGVVPVAGVVTLDGQPLDGASVQLRGVSAGPGADYFCAGDTDASGKFTVVGDEGRTKGAPPGEYIATLTRIVRADGSVLPSKGDISPRAALAAGGKETIPARYTLSGGGDGYRVTIGPDGKCELALKRE